MRLGVSLLQPWARGEWRAGCSRRSMAGSNEDWTWIRHLPCCSDLKQKYSRVRIPEKVISNQNDIWGVSLPVSIMFGKAALSEHVCRYCSKSNSPLRKPCIKITFSTSLNIFSVLFQRKLLKSFLYTTDYFVSCVFCSGSGNVGLGGWSISYVERSVYLRDVGQQLTAEFPSGVDTNS